MTAPSTVDVATRMASVGVALAACAVSLPPIEFVTVSRHSITAWAATSYTMRAVHAVAVWANEFDQPVTIATASAQRREAYTDVDVHGHTVQVFAPLPVNLYCELCAALDVPAYGDDTGPAAPVREFPAGQVLAALDGHKQVNP